ncbi:hypothetical protein IHE61_21540 [Streptomyces sp. GKU 257-1]|nr:hypothetical protein [Streptomyces sp. GKU 257-1]
MLENWNLARSEQFCITFSRNRTQEEVLEVYGASKGAWQALTVFEADEAVGLPVLNPFDNPALVRVGTLGNWTFGIEFDNPIGHLDGILAPLSKKTETILFFCNVRGLTDFRYIVDGRVNEFFEPGARSGNGGSSEYDFFGKFLELATTSSETEAVLTLIANHIGHRLTRETPTGPLLTAVVPVHDWHALRTPNPPPLKNLTLRIRHQHDHWADGSGRSVPAKNHAPLGSRTRILPPR